MVGAVHERAVKGDQVTLCKQGIQAYIFHKILQIRILVDVIGQDLHSKAAADPAHGGANLSSTDDTGCLFMKINAHQTV